MHGVGRLSEPVEIATYYVVCEALANTAKHAHATVVKVAVAVGEGFLRVSVSDDGPGGADFGRGSGLTGLKERVEVLGGRLTLHSPPGSGTVLEVHLPLAGCQSVGVEHRETVPFLAEGQVQGLVY